MGTYYCGKAIDDARLCSNYINGECNTHKDFICSWKTKDYNSIGDPANRRVNMNKFVSLNFQEFQNYAKDEYGIDIGNDPSKASTTFNKLFMEGNNMSKNNTEVTLILTNLTAPGIGGIIKHFENMINTDWKCIAHVRILNASNDVGYTRYEMAINFPISMQDFMNNYLIDIVGYLKNSIDVIKVGDYEMGSRNTGSVSSPRPSIKNPRNINTPQFD